MHNCPVCKTRHSDSENCIEAVQNKLAKLFERILQEYGDSSEIRLAITEYTMGYMGATYGIQVAP